MTTETIQGTRPFKTPDGNIIWWNINYPSSPEWRPATDYEVEQFLMNKMKEKTLGDLVKGAKSDGSTASYYELPKGCTELQHLISHRDMNAQIGEIFRACYRYGIASHSDRLRDAKKIKFYAEAEIERLEKLNG